MFEAFGTAEYVPSTDAAGEQHEIGEGVWHVVGSQPPCMASPSLGIAGRIQIVARVTRRVGSRCPRGAEDDHARMPGVEMVDVIEGHDCLTIGEYRKIEPSRRGYLPTRCS
jgi:hypothetical protein